MRKNRKKHYRENENEKKTNCVDALSNELARLHIRRARYGLEIGKPEK